MAYLNYVSEQAIKEATALTRPYLPISQRQWIDSQSMGRSEYVRCLIARDTERFDANMEELRKNGTLEELKET